MADASAYDPKCVIVTEKRLPLDRIFPVEQNQYILVTEGAELALRCAGHTEQTTVVAAGVFEITLVFPCSLHSATCQLVPVYQRILNLTLSPSSKGIHFTVNDSIADLFQEHIKQDRSVILGFGRDGGCGPKTD